jgi:adenosylcobinamide-phosphate synthase
MICMDRILIFLIAIAIDLILGEPPEKLHPVVYMGKMISFFDKRVKRNNPRREKLSGVFYPILTISSFAIPSLLLFLIAPYSRVIYILSSAFILKTTFAVRSLDEFARETMKDDIDEKRQMVSRIVGRDLTNLDEEHLNSAVIESTSENLTDSIISPFFYYTLFGLFGAMVYRVVNTLDAMIGYKTRVYTNFGYFSAKLDTIMNYLPERIGALFICMFGRRMMRRDRGAPLTITAMSGSLGIKLEKLGYYSIGKNLKPASDENIMQSIKIVKRCALLFASICVIGMILLGMML